MKILYTLGSPMSGEHGKALNGRVFYVKHDKETDHAIFIGVDGTPIWETTTIRKKSHTKSGIIIYTNSMYHLMKVSAIIPTQREDQ